MPTWPALSPLFRLDPLAGVMLALVGFIAVVILRYSTRYLDGQPGRTRYYRWLMATVAAIVALICANHLLVMALAWTVVGLCLHQLLTFFETRPQALVAAHKKFLLSRIADLFIFAGALVIGQVFDTMRIDELLARAAQMQTVPPALHVGGLLLAAGVIIRSAQLPFHGWLIQVMEAPTPVSALLHAGIVNMGGFVMIRLGGLMAPLEFAQMLLVGAGATTAVLAGLVMMTRVSVKVSLAWSTCAQMGFMLLECGLGAYELALLHLVAHSLYKANAFLSSGGRVAESVRQRLVMHASPMSPWRLLAAAGIGAGLVCTVGVFAVPAADRHPSTFVSAVILAFAIAPLLTMDATRRVGDRRPATHWRFAVRQFLAAVIGVVLFALWYRIVAALVPTVEVVTVGLRIRLGFAVIAFTGLFLLQNIILHRPTGIVARRLYPHFLAGFYLDEFITFLTFRVWPPRTRRASTVAPSVVASPALREQLA